MTNRYQEPPTYKARTSEIINALCSERQWLPLLDQQKKAYQPLLDFFIGGGLEFDTTKQLASHLGLSPSKVTKWINMIYEDIWNLNEQQPTSFYQPDCKPVEVHFQGSFYGPGRLFTLYLPILPNYGDSFNWLFILPKLGSSYFYVESIHHYYEQGELKTSLHLQEGMFNRYRHHLLDKADFHELLSFDERYYLSKYRLDDLLRERTKDPSDYPYLRSEATNSHFKKRKF